MLNGLSYRNDVVEMTATQFWIITSFAALGALALMLSVGVILLFLFL